MGEETAKSLALGSRIDSGTFWVQCSDSLNATFCSSWDEQQRGSAIKRSKCSPPSVYSCCCAVWVSLSPVSVPLSTCIFNYVYRSESAKQNRNKNVIAEFRPRGSRSAKFTTGGSCHDLRTCVDNMLLRMTLNLNALIHEVQLIVQMTYTGTSHWPALHFKWPTNYLPFNLLKAKEKVMY